MVSILLAVLVQVLGLGLGIMLILLVHVSVDNKIRNVNRRVEIDLRLMTVQAALMRKRRRQ